MTKADFTADRKKATRQRILLLRDGLNRRQRERSSEVITAKLLSLAEFASASTVAAYMSFGSEFETDEFIQAVLASGKRLVLPRIVPGTRDMLFHVVSDPTQLVPGPWGIREPDAASCAVVPVSEVDLMLVPGVAFTRRCERLGYGGGFYDSVMKSMRPSVMKVAAAFGLQIVDELPVAAHDVAVDMVVTEDAVYSAAVRAAPGDA